MDDNTNQFIRASLWTAVNSYSFFILNFIGQIILARILFPLDYGLYAFFIGIIEVGILFLGFGNTMGFINSEGTQEDFNSCYKLNKMAVAGLLFFALLGFFILLLMHQSTAHAFFFALLCLSQCFLLTAYVYMAPLEKTMQFKKVSFYNGFSSVLSLLIAIVLANYHFSYWSLGLRDLLNYLFLFSCAYYYCPMRVRNDFQEKDHRSQLLFNLKTIFSRSMEVVYYRFSDILIKLTMGQFILGNFYQARTVSFYPIKLTQPFTHKVLFSFFSNIKTDKNLISDRLNWIHYVLVRVFLPLVFLMILFGQPLFVFIYGEKWMLAGKYFEYFSLWIPIAALYAAGLNTFYSLGKQITAGMGYVIAVVVLIIGILFFRTLLPPPIFFTAGLVCGYIYILFMLRKIHLKIDIIQTFILPSIILIISIFVYRYTYLRYSISIFLILYVALLLSERKKIIKIVKKVMASRHTAS